MPPDGSVPHSPAGSAPGSPAKGGKFSWGFGRKSRTPSPSGSMFAGNEQEESDTFRGRKSNPSPSSFVVKSVIKQPGGVSLDVKDENGIYSQSPTSPSAPWGNDYASQQFGSDATQNNTHNDSYKRAKSRPIMSLGVPAGGPGGGVGYGSAHSTNDGRPEAEMRFAAATNAGALPYGSLQSGPGSGSSSPIRPPSPSNGISAEQFQRKVRDRQNSIQNPKEPRQISPTAGPRRAADIAAEARASSRDRNADWTVEPDVTQRGSAPPPHAGMGPQGAAAWTGGSAPSGSGPRPFASPGHPHATMGASPINIPQPAGFRGAGDDSPFGTPSPSGPHSPFGPSGGFGQGDDQDARGRSGSPGFAGFFKGIFGRSPKVDSGSAPGPGGMYTDEHAWMNGETTAPAPYNASQNGSNPSFFGTSGAGGPPVTPLIRNAGARSSLPSPLRFGSAGPQADQDPIEAAARQQKHESMLQAQRIVDQERQRAIDAAVQRRPSSGPDAPWSPRQVVGDAPLEPPPRRVAVDSTGRNASPMGRKPVPKLTAEESTSASGPGDALSRLENMLTPAQRIIQETRSRQLADEKAQADRVARETISQATAMSTPSPASIDKGKARQIDPPDGRSTNAAGEVPVRRGSKKSPVKQVQVIVPNASGPSAISPMKPIAAPEQGPTPPRVTSQAQGSRSAPGLMPGNGPLPKDMTMTDALQEMMVRFYRFERYSVPLLRSMETRLLDIERDAQIALQASDTISANSARDREMDRWVSEMTGMMKHEIGQLRAACREIKEGREIVAQVAQAMNASKDAKPSVPASPASAVQPTVQPKPQAPSASVAIAAPPRSALSDASGSQKMPGSQPTSQLSASTAAIGTAHKVPLTPATLKAVPRPEPGRSSPNSMTADPGLGVSTSTEPTPLLVPVRKPEQEVTTNHQARQTNISSASFQSAVPVAHSDARDASISIFLARTEPSSPSADAARRRAAAAALPASERRSPSPNSKGRPRYTAALGGSVLDSATRTRSPERIRPASVSRPVLPAAAETSRTDSPAPPPSEADTTRSTQSVEDRLKALLRGPESAAAVLDKSPTMTEAELEKEVMSHTTSPPVTEHLRWRSKDSGTNSRSESPIPTMRSGTPSTPHGTSLHKESYFGGLSYGRATPPLSSSPERGTGVFGLMPNRHLKGTSSSSLTNPNTNAVATAGTTRSALNPVSGHTLDPSSTSGTTIGKTLLRSTGPPSPTPATRLSVPSTQAVLPSPSKKTTAPVEYTGVPSEKADDITTAPHASETLRARAASYLKASAAVDEGLSPKPGSWASGRFGPATEAGNGGGGGSGSGSSSNGALSTSTTTSSGGAEFKSKFDGLPGGSAIRSSTWLASDSTNTSLSGAAPRTATLGPGGVGSWASGMGGGARASQYRRASNVGAVGANATLKEKLAFFDSAR